MSVEQNKPSSLNNLFVRDHCCSPELSNLFSAEEPYVRGVTFGQTPPVKLHLENLEFAFHPILIPPLPAT